MQRINSRDQQAEVPPLDLKPAEELKIEPPASIHAPEDSKRERDGVLTLRSAKDKKYMSPLSRDATI